jgi:hypothetical protein
MSELKQAGLKEAGLIHMVSKMKSAEGNARDNGFTLGWDLVVSYSEKEINELLADRYKRVRKHSLPSDFVFYPNIILIFRTILE